MLSSLATKANKLYGIILRWFSFSTSKFNVRNGRITFTSMLHDSFVILSRTKMLVVPHAKKHNATKITPNTRYIFIILNSATLL